MRNAEYRSTSSLPFGCQWLVFTSARSSRGPRRAAARWTSAPRRGTSLRANLRRITDTISSQRGHPSGLPAIIFSSDSLLRLLRSPFSVAWPAFLCFPANTLKISENDNSSCRFHLLFSILSNGQRLGHFLWPITLVSTSSSQLVRFYSFTSAMLTFKRTYSTSELIQRAIMQQT